MDWFRYKIAIPKLLVPADRETSDKTGHVVVAGCGAVVRVEVECLHGSFDPGILPFKIVTF